MAVVGQTIDDKYEILKLIGQGGMSKVYLAMDKRLNKQWAIKEIEKKAKDKNNEIVIQSAIAEANLIKQLDHPAIVRIVDIIDNGDVIYIIEDYIEGETLSTILENNGAQPQELVIEWAMQICEALEYLHTRKPPIIYRDMKPANVMLKPDGNIKVIDFGIAREYKDQSLADTVSLGTKGYAAPEQFGGRGQTDARTDVYCLGVTLYHLLTGQNPCEPPYEIYPIRHWNPQLSAGLEAIIQKCTQLNPDDRYQSCAELLYALHHYEEYGAAYRARQKRKLNAFIGTVCASVFCLIIGIFGLFMRTKTNNADYDQNIASAETATTYEDNLKYYAEAITIKPDSEKAYLGLIDILKKDRNFSLEEEKDLMAVINAHEKYETETYITQFKSNPQYAKFAFEVGKLYWYYYEYEDDAYEILRMSSAIPWFTDATNQADTGVLTSEELNMAKNYISIGDFKQNIDAKIIEGDDQDLYLPYWTSLNGMYTSLSESDNEIVKLNVYRLVVNSIENYARKFKNNADVSREDMQSIYDKVMNDVNGLSTSSDTTETIKTEITRRLESTQAAIDNAYRE